MLPKCIGNNLIFMIDYDCEFAIAMMSPLTTSSDSLSAPGFNASRVFHKLYETANCGIFIFTTWKQKKNSDKMLPPVGIEPGPLIASDSKSNTILSTQTWHLLVRLRL